MLSPNVQSSATIQEVAVESVSHLPLKDIEELIASPDLLDGLVLSSLKTNASSEEATIRHLTAQIQASATRVKAARLELAEERELLAHKKAEWLAAESEMHQAVRPHTTSGIIAQLRQDQAEQESLGSAMLASFLDGSEPATAADIQTFLRDYKQLREATWMQHYKLKGLERQ